MKGIILEKISRNKDGERYDNLYYFVKDYKNWKKKDSGNELEVPSTGKQKLFKYMSFKHAIECIKEQYLYFQKPSEWNDKFEELYYNADYSNLNFPPPKLYAICFTTQEKRESAWNSYSEGSSAVQFIINKFELREQLHEYISKNEEGISKGIEGKMIYKDEKEILKLPKKFQGNSLRENKIYPIYFPQPFTFDDFMYLLCLKRTDFKEEEEVRFFLCPSTEAEEANFLKVKIDLSSIIKGIKLSSNIKSNPDNDNNSNDDDNEYKLLKEVCQQCGLKDINIEHYKLYDNPNGRITIDAPNLQKPKRE